MRRKFVEAARAEQIAREKQMIQSHLDRLSPGPRQLHLKARLNKSNGN
jgi:hypothetical protein